MGARARLILAALAASACAHEPPRERTRKVIPPHEDFVIADDGPPRCLDVVVRPTGLIDVQRGREREVADVDADTWAAAAGALCAERAILIWTVEGGRGAFAEKLRTTLEAAGATDVTVRTHRDEAPGTVLRTRAAVDALGLAAAVPADFDFTTRALLVVDVSGSCTQGPPALITLPLARDSGHLVVETPAPTDGACQQRALAVVPRTSLPIVARARGLSERFVP